MLKFNRKLIFQNTNITGSITLICLLFVLALSIQAGINYLIMLAWNYVAPIFNGPQLTFWQTTIIIILITTILSLFRTKSNSK